MSDPLLSRDSVRAVIEELRAGPIPGEIEKTHRLMLLAADILADAVDPIADVEAFHEKFGLRYEGKPRALPADLATFRRKFLLEEIREYTTAMYMAEYNRQERPDRLAVDLEKMLDALVDEVYVAIGTAQLHGFDFREAWRRVHRANMAKARAASAADSKRGSAYDVVKPPGWQAPSHADLVADHAHKETP